MTTSILLLAFMLVLVLLQRKGPSVRVRKTGPSQYGPAQTGWGAGANKSALQAGPKMPSQKVPSKVSYELMEGKRLPSSSQLRMRRVLRPFSAAWRWVRPGKAVERGEEQNAVRTDRKSAELENFLEARNREIERRKTEAAKRGPEDQLH